VLRRHSTHRNPHILLPVAVLGSVFMLAWIPACALLATPESLAAQQSGDVEKKLKSRSLHWSPPALDTPVHGLSSSSPCALAQVLEQAGGRAVEMITNLQNFTAQEKIQYQTSDLQNFVKDFGSETFEYVVVFGPLQKGLVVQENRNPTRGSNLSPVATQDAGLPEMLLIFLPKMQEDYDMSCEGAVEWNGHFTWVVRFRQRRDRPSRTFSFRVEKSVYPARLEGRAWIASDSGEIVHMETGLMEEVPAVKVRHWSLSIDYAPVQFQTQSIKIWLPQTVDGYCDYGDHRTIVYHTFTDFLLFSVQTDQKIEKPKQP
jgi:hypothetical protein